MAKEKEKDIRQHPISQEYVDDSSNESSSETTSPEKVESTVRSLGGAESGSESDHSGKSESERSGSGSDSEQSVTKKRQSEISLSSTEPKNKRAKANTFTPPSGHVPIEESRSDLGTDVERMFSKLDDKQVWHITAPASVSLESIQSLDMAAAVRGEPILHHNGTDYNLFAIPSKGESLLLPAGGDNVYSKAKINISRSFHLRELLYQKAEVVDTDSATDDPVSVSLDLHEQRFFASAEGAKKPPREQPAGLLMRYQPYGRAETIEKSYLLPRPETDDENDREDGVQSEENKVFDASYKPSKKSKDGKKSSKSKKSHKQHAEASDLMEIDIDSRNPGVVTTESKKKRKKDRREKESASQPV